MMTRTDCDARFANQARHAAAVNQHAWLRPFPATDVPSRPARLSARARVSGALIALGTRLAPAARNTASTSPAR
jgi:hypothetical protein